jgi:hypothetical protein
MRCQRDLRELKKGGCAYADLADGDTPATPAAGGRHKAGHYTVTGGVHHHGLYRLRPFLVKDKAVGVPAKQLDALMVLAIKGKTLPVRGDIFISERTSLYSPLIPLRMSTGCWHM